MIDEKTILIRLLLACLCGGLVGLERTHRMKDAGIRTHSLLALAACGMMMLSRYAFAGEAVNFDVTRIAAQIVTGISFVGAGVIYRDDNTMRGLSTAAGIWATAGIGMAFGCGMYFLGGMITLLLIVIQVSLHMILIGNDAFSGDRFIISYVGPDTQEVEALLAEAVKSGNIQLGDLSTSKDEEGRITYRRFIKFRVRYDIAGLQKSLNELPAVRTTDFE